jgi:hypothetical protein
LHFVTRISEGRVRSLLKFPLTNCLHRNFQPSTRVLDAIAKKFAFRRMNQRMGRQNFRKRRQRTAGGEEQSGTCDLITAFIQFPDDLLDRPQS